MSGHSSPPGAPTDAAAAPAAPSGASPSVGTSAAPSAAAASRPAGASRRMVWLLAVTCGLVVANLYYCQPLLPQIASSFKATQSEAGTLVTALQVGYAVALFLVVPLGDILRRRRLVCVLLLIEAVALAATAAAPSLWPLLAASAVVGVASCVVQILVPYAATIAADHERGRVMGTVLTGVLVGILLSRTVAGFLGQALGWRAVFVIATLMMALLTVVLARVMDGAPAEVEIGYGEQLRATLRLMATQPVLRRRSLIGACVFAAFGLFWATIAFLLAGRPFHYDQAQIGLFALVGAAGAAAAQLIGRVADRGHQRVATGLLLALGVASFGAIGLGARSLAWLILGVVAMDAAVQGTHLLNMSVVYNLFDGARSRIASAYMTSYFIGGALGSAAGSQAYRIGGWGAVAASGAVIFVVGLAVWAWDLVAARRTTAADRAARADLFASGSDEGDSDAAALDDEPCDAVPCGAVRSDA